LKDPKPTKLSRTKIELFCQCPCCFYLDRKCGIGRPPSLPFTLNNAVDALWKKEFDHYRSQGKPHPVMVAHGIDAIPFQHECLDAWRSNFRGVIFLHEPTQFLVSGAPDEIWITPQGNLIVVDVKATSKASEVNLDAAWQMGYKRQMEIYQWLLRQNGFKVSSRGYFVYCNGKRDEPSSGTLLAFDVSIIPYDGGDSWIEPKLHEIRACLTSDEIPTPSSDCQLCSYRLSIDQLLSSKSPEIVP
jgi:PD-(D/E)XK nuclease superfamily